MRLLGWALILYGLAGLLLVAGSALLGIDAASRIERLSTSADGTLVAATRSTEAAADAFGNVNSSLAEAEASASAAAGLAREASATLASLAQAMQLSVLGAQPLLPLAGEFESSSAQASALADTLDRVGGSLAGTRTDVEDIGAELDELSAELETLRDAGDSGGSTPPLRLLVALLLAWLLVPSIGGLLGGLALLRLARTRPQAH